MKTLIVGQFFCRLPEALIDDALALRPVLVTTTRDLDDRHFYSSMIGSLGPVLGAVGQWAVPGPTVRISFSREQKNVSEIGVKEHGF